MRIRNTESRERSWKRLQEATDEETKSKAIDKAIRFYLAMGAVDRVGDKRHRVGAFDDLLEAAAERGSLTAPEIAAILDTPQLPLEAETSYSIGD